MNDSTTVQIKSTTDYDKFVILGANRDLNEGHVAKLVRAMTETGNLTKIDPITINERGEVIDGQHRLEACKQLEVPVYYMEFEGLNIDDATQMNLLHRNWNNLDYAKRYATTGNKNYIRYLQLVEDYPTITGTVIVIAVYGRNVVRMNSIFKEGEFELDEEFLPTVIDRLEKLITIQNVVGPLQRGIAKAFVQSMDISGYKHEQMLKKLVSYPILYRPYTQLADNLRMLEDIYNHNQPQETRLRLY